MKILLTSFLILTISISASNAADAFSWEELPPLPNESGVVGPFAGTHNDALIVAGGANFPKPVWETDKAWHDEIFVLTKAGDDFIWKDGGKLARPIAYGAAVSTPDGVVCMGGNDAESTFDDVFLLSWDASAQSITTTKYPSLPEPCAFGAATLVGDVIYLAGGQNGQSLETAMKNFWALDLLKRRNPDEFVWQKLPAWPGPSRALNLTVNQHTDGIECVYVISGRRQENKDPGSVEFLKDVWEYTPAKREWRKWTDAPRCVMAGTSIGHGPNQILVLGGADGSLFFKGDELKDQHPGFPKKALTYDTVADRWSEAGTTPRNHVTTIAVEWDGAIIVPSGEVRPRVRSPKVWRVTPTTAQPEKNDLFEAGADGYALYRIPGIVVTKNGTVLAYCEARKNEGGDWGPIDVMMRRSTDGGKTWLPRQKIVHVEGDLPINPLAAAQNLDKPGDNTVNNPVAIVDHETGAVHFLYCLEYMRCFYIRSDDDGATWTKPVEITKTFEDFRSDYDWKVLATGPSHAIQLTHGPRRGRLVVPVWLSLGTGGHAHRPSVTATIYTDDHGKTWQRGDIAVPDTPEFVYPNETVVVQLADGSVMLNTRSESKAHRRLVTISPDGATNWSQPSFDEQLLESICMAGLVRVRMPQGDQPGVLAFSNPHNLSRADGKEAPGKNRDRKNVTIKLSDDEGQTWSASRTLEPGFSGYSDLATLPDGTILCFYERGSTDGKTRHRTGKLTVARLTEDWVRDGIEADVCVYGGTSGGVVAAVQAARMGKRVVLIEPGRHLGGLTSGGLSAVDIGEPRSVGGIAREYFSRLVASYGKTLNWGQPFKGKGGPATGGAYSIEPHVAERVFDEMVKEAGGTVLRDARLKSVQKQGSRITELKTEDGRSVRAKMFLDTTYEGDLLAAAGVSYTVTREGNDKYGEIYNGIHYAEKYKPRANHGKPRANGRVPGGQGVWDRDFPLDPYVVKGDPTSGLLPLVSEGEPGKAGDPAPGVMAYCFRLCLSTADDWLPIKPPPNYDPKTYELVARFIAACQEIGDDMDLRWFSKHDPLPNQKWDFNTATFGGNLPGASWEWPLASYDRRAEIAKEIENYHRGLLHFLATDPRVPEKVRNDMARFGLPRDEFTDRGGWPHQIYVREGRRMVSDLVLTEHHTFGREVAPKSIGLGSYGTDIHEIRRIVKDGVVIREGKVAGGRGRFGPYQIGYGSIVPKQSECENLFATFALSASHPAFASIRMEPVFMVTSQSAATAACLAIDDKVAVQEVDYEKLKTRLLADGQVLSWPPAGVDTSAVAPRAIVRAASLPGIVLDDDKAEYQGDWKTSNGQPSPIGASYRHDGSTDRGKKNATFTATIPKAGEYEIRFLFTSHENRSTRTKVTVTGADEEKTFRINQREPAMKNRVPKALGIFRFKAGATARVTVSNDGADGYVVVDGLQILPAKLAREERAGKQPSGYAALKTTVKPSDTRQSSTSSSAVAGRGHTGVVGTIARTPFANSARGQAATCRNGQQIVRPVRCRNNSGRNRLRGSSGSPALHVADRIETPSV